MKREEMNKIIRFELGYIPKGSRGSIQNKLRFYYNAYRRRYMVRGKQREESLKEAINRLKEDYPTSTPYLTGISSKYQEEVSSRDCLII